MDYAPGPSAAGGLSSVCLGAAAFTASRQRRGVVGL
jgi:hypothetical protein